MDTKKLYERLDADRFDWSDYDLGHAKTEALKILLEPDELVEYWIDALCDMPDEQEYQFLTHMCNELSRAAEKPVNTSSYARSNSTVLIVDAVRASHEISGAIEKYLDKLIDDNLCSWLASAYEHKCSAEEGMRDDYEYERYKERRMEGLA